MEPRSNHGSLPGAEPGSISARAGSMRLTCALTTLCALVRLQPGPAGVQLIPVIRSRRTSRVVSGRGCRLVTINELGNEVIEDHALPGYEGATNNEMELMACIRAL